MRSAFTLIELIIVIAIIVIIASIAIPKIMESTTKSVQDNGVITPERMLPVKPVIKDGGKINVEK